MFVFAQQDLLLTICMNNNNINGILVKLTSTYRIHLQTCLCLNNDCIHLPYVYSAVLYFGEQLHSVSIVRLHIDTYIVIMLPDRPL